MVNANLKESISELKRINGIKPKTPEFYIRSSLILMGNILVKDKSDLGEDVALRLSGLCDRIRGFWGRDIPTAIEETLHDLEQDSYNACFEDVTKIKEVINDYINLVNIFITYLIKKLKMAA